jgi:hypothetical protein
MTVRQLLLVCAASFAVSLPAHAGSCAKDIERMQMKLDARLNALAAAGPSAKQSLGAQLHRQPTPRSVAGAEHRLGEVSSSTMAKVGDAMTRARKADAAGDESACQRALTDVEQAIVQ